MITDCRPTVKKILKKMKGKCNETAMSYLCELVQSLSDTPGWLIDLGTYYGRSAMVLAMASLGDQQKRRIISIDNYQEGRNAQQEIGPDNPAPTFWQTHGMFKCRTRVHLVFGDTADVPPICQGEKIALVFVDGDHRREQLEKDILAWKPLIRVGGMMVFDDYGSQRWPDVQEVVDELMGDWTRLDCKGSVIAFRR